MADGSPVREVEAGDQSKMNNDLATRVRNIPLVRVLEYWQYKPSAKDKKNYETAAGRITVNGEKFFNHDLGKGGGGAIDLVMQLEHCDFKAAVARLAGEPISAAQTPPAPPRASEMPASIRTSLPEPSAANWPQVRRYLVGDRKLNAAVVDALHADGRIYADAMANACFALGFREGKYVGVELRGTQPGSTYHGVRGKKSWFWLAARKAAEERVALVESAIDAISLADLGFGGRIVSVAGGSSMEYYARLLAKFPRLVAAFDADKAGDTLAAALAAHHPAVERMRPENAKDWNELLLRRG